jgi:hypothetical protein
LTPVSSSWSAARATRCGTVSILTSCSTNRTPDACQPTQVVDACRSILERWAEPADLLVAKVSPGLSVGHCKRGFRCIGCILILVSELLGHTGGTWISRSPIRRSRAPYRAAGQPSRAHQAGHRPPVGWFGSPRLRRRHSHWESTRRAKSCRSRRCDLGFAQRTRGVEVVAATRKRHGMSDRHSETRCEVR